ncbi:hypothetical protein OBBRIDRAFT_833232 [Obba rivulosa]|uniref:Uncharacterized protein n=1 Tax=Obba rivulosa TaxID=1052685 RepID=A0A8E2B2L7_9APHY|nr:hypothetical protein OBBRIDRAFT_833232 [Obba rivulosa]
MYKLPNLPPTLRPHPLHQPLLLLILLTHLPTAHSYPTLTSLSSVVLPPRPTRPVLLSRAPDPRPTRHPAALVLVLAAVGALLLGGVVFGMRQRRLHDREREREEERAQERRSVARGMFGLEGGEGDGGEERKVVEERAERERGAGRLQRWGRVKEVRALARRHGGEQDQDQDRSRGGRRYASAGSALAARRRAPGASTRAASAYVPSAPDKNHGREEAYVLPELEIEKAHGGERWYELDLGEDLRPGAGDTQASGHQYTPVSAGSPADSQAQRLPYLAPTVPRGPARSPRGSLREPRRASHASRTLRVD